MGLSLWIQTSLPVASVLLLYLVPVLPLAGEVALEAQTGRKCCYDITTCLGFAALLLPFSCLHVDQSSLSATQWASVTLSLRGESEQFSFHDPWKSSTSLPGIIYLCFNFRR